MVTNTELHARLLDDAQRYDSSAHHRCLLAPHRDVLLLWRVKYMSYEQIALTLATHGLNVSASAIGVFCRSNFTREEILRERRRLGAETRGPAVTAPSSGRLFAITKPVAPVPPGKRGPKVARDDY